MKPSAFKIVRSLAAAIGWPGTAAYLLNAKLGRAAVYTIHSPLARHPLRVRRGSSDINVFHQIFVEQEYQCLDDLRTVRFVLDCGANVGYSSAYFLSRFPDCQLTAVEPDPGNFTALERNLAPYGSRVKLVRAGVWSHATGLKLAETVYRDGREWARQVRPANAGEAPDFTGTDIGTLLAESGHDRISLLKMDIEGAEAIVFAEGRATWLDKVDAFAIELHDDSVFGNGSEIFRAAIAGHDFILSESGELAIGRRSARA